MRHTWDVRAEVTDQIRENPALPIDLLVRSSGRATIVIENELQPASTVAQDARGRLGKTLNLDGTPINQVVELRTPGTLRECESLQQAEQLLRESELEYAVIQRPQSFEIDASDATSTTRIPPIPGTYLRGSIYSFADFLSYAGLNSSLLSEAIRELDSGVQDSIAILRQTATTDAQFKARLADLLMQSFADDDFDQGLGVAVTVAINATLFQQRLSSNYEGVMSLAQMRVNDRLNQAGLIEQWRHICKINYWPIFSIAISVLEAIKDPYIASRFILRLYQTTQRLIDLAVVDTHDICGIIFQRFMTERKNLASYFTRPESATLLAHLAVPNQAWNEESNYRNFKFADFSCGTGALVYSVYQRIANLCEFGGGDASAHHAHMMENNITAADIVPSAAHLTATLLSSLYPKETYNTSRVVIPQYGEIEGEGGVVLGSLELLDDEATFSTLFPNPDDTKVMGGTQNEALSYELLIAPSSQDLVIMNPPYTRAMSDWVEKAEGTWKPFRALGNSTNTQQLMHARERKITRSLDCYNGYQSMPSAFCGLADRMLKEGGVFAFVLPSTALQGISWRGFRKMLAERYRNIIVVSIAARNAKDSDWSADTNLAEVLIIATKRTLDERKVRSGADAILVNLRAKPPNTMLAAEYASEIKRTLIRESVSTIEDGPRGGTVLEIGDERVGELISVPITEESWPALGIRDFSLAQFAHQLCNKSLWFPRQKTSISASLPLRPIGEFAVIGFAANNIANNQNAAFSRKKINAHADFPMVWRNDTKKQRKFLIEPDMEGRIREGKEDLAFRTWNRRSKSLIACEVAYASQSLICTYSTQPAIGGRAWPNVQLQEERHEKAFVLWGNSSLGAIAFWYCSSRQQVRRSIVTVTSIARLPWLDPTSLDDGQLDQIDDIFDEFSLREFLPLGQMSQDADRKELDRRLLIDVLRLPSEVLESVQLLREKWCAEPAIQS